MEVAYRKMRIEDEDAVFGLRMRTWGAPSIDYVRQGARLDPHYLRRTFVAVGSDGNLLSTVRYWVRLLRDTSGTPQPVACVASVVTVETARRQGHARELMQLAIEEMRTDDCVWSLLESSKMGVPLYKGLGFHHMPAPYYRGACSDKQPSFGDKYHVERVEPPFNFADENWQAVRAIYAEYNADRALSLVRDDAYWDGYYARRVASRLATHAISLFVARSADGAHAGYLIGDYSASNTDGFDQSVYISEIGILPGQEGAIPCLLSSLLASATSGNIELSVRAPRVGRVDSEIRSLYIQEIELLDVRMMALPLAHGSTESEISAIFETPGALFWTIDDF